MADRTKPAKKPRKPSRSRAAAVVKVETSPIDATIALTEGSTITIGERIVDLVGQVGAQPDRAARACGIDKATFDAWIEQAELTRATLAATPTKRQTVHALACLRLVDRIDEAAAVWEMTSLTALEQLAMGYQASHTIEVVTVNADGTTTVVERRTKTWHQAPQAAVLQWKLSRLLPGRFQLVTSRATDDVDEFTATFDAGDAQSAEIAQKSTQGTPSD